MVRGYAKLQNRESYIHEDIFECLNDHCDPSFVYFLYGHYVAFYEEVTVTVFSIDIARRVSELVTATS